MALEFTVKMNDEVTANADKAAGSTSDLTKQMGSLQSSMSNVPSSMGSVGSSMGNVGEQASGAGGEVSDLSAELAEATGGLSLIVEAAVAAAAAFGVLLIAVAGVTQQAKLLRDQINAVGGEAGPALNAMVSDLSSKLPESKDKIGEMTVKLTEMGYTADEVRNSIIAMSSANAIAAGSGDALINTLRKISAGGKLTAKDLKAVGVSPAELAAAMGMNPAQLESELKKGGAVTQKAMSKIEDIVTKKGAGPLADKMQQLGTIWDKFKQNILDLFEGVADTPGFKAFVAAVSSFFNMFSSQSGDMKKGFTSAFGAMFNVAAKVLNWMTVAILKVATFGVRAYIWAFPAIKAFKQWEQRTGFLSKLWFVLKMVGLALAVVAAVVTGVFVAAFLMGVAIVGAFIAALAWIVTGLVKVAGVIGAFVSNSVAKLGKWIESAKDSATKFVAGLMGGLAEGIPGVEGMSKKLGDAASAAMNKSLQTHSPSRLTFETGKNVGQGLVGGMDSMAGDVHASATDMAGGAAAGASSGAKGGGAKGGDGGGVHFHFAPGSIVIGGGGNGAQTLDEEAVMLVFERAAEASGLLPT
jgi:hypothetical protein